MLKANQVPKELIEIARYAYWHGPNAGFADVIAAVINAWPGKKAVTEYYLCESDHFEPAIILPLQEPTNDQ